MPIDSEHPNYDREYDGVGIIANRFKGDPRINKKQLDAIEAACKADNKSLLMGMDEHNRPVIRARVGVPRESRSWAILRNGDPASPGRIFEAWVQEPTSRATPSE